MSIERGHLPLHWRNNGTYRHLGEYTPMKDRVTGAEPRKEPTSAEEIRKATGYSRVELDNEAEEPELEVSTVAETSESKIVYFAPSGAAD